MQDSAARSPTPPTPRSAAPKAGGEGRAPASEEGSSSYTQMRKISVVIIDGTNTTSAAMSLPLLLKSKKTTERGGGNGESI